MEFEDGVVIAAPIDAVWSVYSDVERWPEWASSVRDVRFVRGSAVEPGARARIEQPRLPKAEWEVTALEPGRAWTWESRAPGIRTVATHTLEAVGPASTHVRMTLTQRGPLGAVMGRVYAALTRKYLAIEAAGLKERCGIHASA
jgi:uncharacterized membrane protein